MEEQKMFPKEFKCPFCGVVLELEEDEMRSPQIFCASCQKEIYLSDLDDDAVLASEVESVSQPVKTPPKADHRFETLLFTGKVTSGIGWVITGIGLIAIILGFSGMLAGESFSSITLIPGIGCIISGIMMIAAGQLISCFVAIEENTRKTVNLLKKKGK